MSLFPKSTDCRYQTAMHGRYITKVTHAVGAYTVYNYYELFIHAGLEHTHPDLTRNYVSVLWYPVYMHRTIICIAVSAGACGIYCAGYCIRNYNDIYIHLRTIINISAYTIAAIG